MSEIGQSRQNTAAVMRADSGARYGGPQPAFYGYGANGHATDGYGQPQQYLGAYDLNRQGTTVSAVSRYEPEPAAYDDQHGPAPNRSGTPTNSNPQMVYTGDARDSYGSGSGPDAIRREPPSHVTPVDRARRTLSVRNGGLDEYGPPANRASVASHLSDAYGGM